MDRPLFKSLFAKSKRGSSSEKRKRTLHVPTTGAHELFLEYEGFLSPPDPRPRTPTDSRSKRGRPRESRSHREIETAVSGENSDLSAPYREETGQSFHVARDSSYEPQMLPQRKPSQQKKSFFSLGHPLPAPNGISLEKHTVTSQADVVAQESNGCPPTSSWLRRYMSLSSRQHPSPPPSIITVPSYHEDQMFDDDDDLTALPVLPGYEKEISKLPDTLGSGAAARAAAAAQNEILESLRDFRIAEPKLTRDSESGVGMDDHSAEDAIQDFDFNLPVSRQDPLSVLPEELIGHILSYLDAKSLTNAELVSRSWLQSASSRHVWKEIFRNEFQDICQKAVIRRGGHPGLGKGIARQDWKGIWKARKALHQRWADGHAAAIYLEGHTDSVYCVQFDEDKIVTGSRDRTVRVWDARTYRCIKVIGVPSRPFGTSIPLLPVEADRGARPFVKVFPRQAKENLLPDLSTIAPYMYHNGSILCLQYDNDIMVTGSSDCTLIMWDVKLGYKPVRRLKRHTAGVLDVRFDHRHLVSCSKDATICLWDRHSGAFLRKLSGHRGPVNAVQLRDDLVVSASGDGIAKLWNITSGLCIKEFPSKDRGLACVEFSPDSRTILAGGNDQVVYQFDASTGELIREMKGHQGLVRSLHLDSASGRVVSGSYDTSVKAYDLRSGDTIVDFTKWTSSWILSAKADYRRIIATSQDGRAVIMDFGYQLSGIEALEA